MFTKAVREDEYVKLWIADGIMHSEFKPNCIITLEVAKKIVQDRIDYSEGVSYPGLVDMRNIKRVEFRAMIHLASNHAYQLTNKVAVFSDMKISKYLFSIWIKFDKPPVPTRYFLDKGAAYLFLKDISAN